MMYNKIISIIVIFVFLSCVSSRYNEKTISLNNEIIEIVLSTDKDNVWGLFLNITGNITGEIKLEIERCDTDDNFKYIHSYVNDVNYYFSRSDGGPADYYSNVVIIRIIPIGNCEGDLIIKYNFAK